MKKILLTSVGALGALIGAANAGITKEQCEKIRRMVWVEKDQTCILREICGSDSSQKDFYCNRIFAKTQTRTDNQAYRLVNMYLTKKGDGNKCQQAKLRDGKSNNTGQDFVQCITTDGYYEFEFDDVSEMSIETSMDSIAQVVCAEIYSGNFVEGGTRRSEYYRYDYGCSDISKEDCDALADDLRAIESPVVFESTYREEKLDDYAVGESRRLCGITAM